MTDENNQIKFFLYENWARTKTGQHTVSKICERNLPAKRFHSVKTYAPFTPKLKHV